MMNPTKGRLFAIILCILMSNVLGCSSPQNTGDVSDVDNSTDANGDVDSDFVDAGSDLADSSADSGTPTLEECQAISERSACLESGCKYFLDAAVIEADESGSCVATGEELGLCFPFFADNMIEWIIWRQNDDGSTTAAHVLSMWEGQGEYPPWEMCETSPGEPEECSCDPSSVERP